jgi:PAS domain S-box-containing protein
VALPPTTTEPAAWPIRPALMAGGGVLAVLGAGILAAWAAGEPVVIQVHTQFAPTHANAALALLAWGVGLLALAAGRFRLARACGIAVGFGAGVTLLARAVGVGSGLETWLFPANRFLPAVPLGGMNTAAAVGFALGGLGLWATARAPVGRIAGRVGAVAGLGLAVGTAAAVADYPLGLTPSGASGPAVGTCLGLFVGGLSVFAAAARGGWSLAPRSSTIPAVIGVAGTVLALFFWHTMSAQQDARVRRLLQLHTETVQGQLKDGLAARVAKLTEVARLVDDPDLVRTRAGAVVGAEPGCIAVARVAEDGEFLWVETTGRIRFPDRVEETGAEAALAKPRAEGTTAVVRAPRSAWANTRILLVYVPIKPGLPNEGGVLGVFQLQSLLDTICHHNVSPGYAVELVADGEVVYSRYGTDQTYRAEFVQPLPVTFAAGSWRVSAWPTEAGLSQENFSQPRLVLAVGVVTTLLMMLAAHLAQTARRRARALEKEMRDRVTAEAAVKQSEAKYRSLIENMDEGIYLKGPDGRYLAANANYCRRMNKDESELLGRTDAEVIGAEPAKDRSEQEHAVIATGKRVEAEEEATVNGRVRTIRRAVSIVRDEDGRPAGVLGICWDVTEHRALEAKVRQAGKMDALGQLAGGIAHDFNNLLTAIVGNLDLMTIGLPPGDRNRELAESALGAATRATSLTGRLLGFARQHQLDREPTVLNGVVDEVVALLRRTIDPRIKLETALAPDLWPVHADPAQMNQLLMNLCLNARDAISGAGRIRIETAGVEFREGDTVTRIDIKPGCYVRLRVADDGSGMPPEVRARIFEPFFTTKEVGKGTGLGLAMVFGIVKQHNGFVECRSAVGKGTTFEIFLPRTAAAAPPKPVATAEPAKKAAASETILVADDEAQIRKLTSAVLRRQGYEVIEAEDGQQAVQIYTREHHRIALAVLDLTMPVLSGQDAFRQMLKVNPDARVMFSSGYAAEQISDEERAQIAGFVKKPYRPSELVRQVQEALERSPVPAGA